MTAYLHPIPWAAVLVTVAIIGCDAEVTACPDGAVAFEGRCVPALDSGSRDAGPEDGGSRDAAPHDTGTPDAVPCGGACAGETPVCDAATDTCVQCVGAADCPDEAPVCTSEGECVECETGTDCDDGVCDPDANACVECLERADCSDPAAPACDTTTNTCVECTEATDCTDPGASVCDVDTDECIACEANTDCAHLDGLGVCDAGTCVECTGVQDEVCRPYVCDALARTCSEEETVGSAGRTCSGCISNAHCPAGHVCVERDGGHFCLWREDADVSPDAPAGNCWNARGYPQRHDRRSGIETIDGTRVPAVCVPRSGSVSCPALADLSRDCSTPTGPDNALCGAPGVDDGVCAPMGSGSFGCTVRCFNDIDCPLDLDVHPDEGFNECGTPVERPEVGQVCALVRTLR